MTKKAPDSIRGRLPIALTAGAAAVATAAVLAAAGSAQTQPTTTLHLKTNAQKNVGFFPKHPPKPGDRFGLGDRITGDDTGYSQAVCTLVGGKGGLPCTVWITLSKGTLTAQGLFPERAHNTQVAITGGTGAYDGARGTAYATDINQTSSVITVHLLP